MYHYFKIITRRLTILILDEIFFLQFFSFLFFPSSFSFPFLLFLSSSSSSLFLSLPFSLPPLSLSFSFFVLPTLPTFSNIKIFTFCLRKISKYTYYTRITDIASIVSKALQGNIFSLFFFTSSSFRFFSVI